MTERMAVTAGPMIEQEYARAHVDIQLIRSAGNMIAEKQDDINPLHPAPGGGLPHWSAEPLEEMIATTAAFRLDGSLSQAAMTVCKSGSRAENGLCEALCESCFASS